MNAGLESPPEPELSHAGSATWRATHREAEMELVAGLGYGSRWRLAVADMVEGFRLSRLARSLGWLDIKTRYRGSMLGPFWLTLSTAVQVLSLGFLYSILLHTNVHDYLPFLTLSIVLWGFLQALVMDGCTVFTQSDATIRSLRMPFFVFAGQSIYRNMLILAHNLVVIVLVLAWFRIWPGLHLLALLPAAVLWVMDAVAATLLLGAFCARFRDVPPIVGSVLQIAFYISPVIWKPDLLPPSGQHLLLYDPFYTLFEILRGPILGHAPSLAVWQSAVAYSVALCIVAWFAFVRVRSRIAFWI